MVMGQHPRQGREGEGSEQASQAWVHGGPALSWPLGRRLCGEHVAEPPREARSRPSGGEGAHTYACVMMVLAESRKVTEGGWFTLPGGRNQGGHGHQSIRAQAGLRGDRAPTPWATGGEP